MAAKKDYYQALGIARGANDADIKRAYRRLARKLHPDVTGDDPHSTERFKAITEAYDVLSDPKRRRSYDLFGAEGVKGAAPVDDSPFSGVADFVSSFIKRATPAGPEPGVDVEHPLSITLAEAFAGCEKTFALPLLRPCAVCEGHGFPKDKPPETCSDCHGSGRKVSGMLPIGKVCTTCSGLGKVRRYTCKACAGEGNVTVEERLKLVVPAGVFHHTRLRMRGRGAAGTLGAPPGDLYVVLEIEDDPRFEREGADLKTAVTVGLGKALLGGAVTVPLLDGNVQLHLPPGTQGGQVFRLKDKGFVQRFGEGRGSVYVTVQLRVKKHLTADEHRAVELLLANDAEF